MSSDLITSIFHSEPTVKFCDLFNGMSPLWNYALHNHPYIELVYRKRGCGRTALLGETQNFKFFDTVVYPVGCWHQDKFEATAENEALCLWISLPGIELENPMQVQDRNSEIGNLFHAIHEEQQKFNSSPELISLMVRTLLIKVLLYNEEAEPSAVNRVIQYLHTNMAKKITLDELVTISYMSKSYLEKQFKKETGKTIIEYLNQIRIDAAKMLMMTTTKTATEISYSVGFVSPKYFFRIFKQITGMTPTAFAKYKKQVQGEDGEVTQEAVQQ